MIVKKPISALVVKYGFFAKSFFQKARNSIKSNSQDVLNLLKSNKYIGFGCKKFQNDQTMQSEYEQTKTTRCMHVLITTHAATATNTKLQRSNMFTLLSQCQLPPLPTDPNFLSNTGFLRSLSFKKHVTRSKEVFLFTLSFRIHRTF